MIQVTKDQICEMCIDDPAERPKVPRLLFMGDDARQAWINAGRPDMASDAPRFRVKDDDGEPYREFKASSDEEAEEYFDAMQASHGVTILEYWKAGKGGGWKMMIG